MVLPENAVLKDVLDKLTNNDWYTLKVLPLLEPVKKIVDDADYFIIYFKNDNISPVVCAKVCRSSFRKYGKRFRVY